MSPAKKPSSSLPPIWNLSALSFLLEIEEHDLVSLAENSASYWRQGKLLKKKNSTELRKTHDAHDPLKKVHERIKVKILRKFNYPLFMLGGISDPINPRSCKQHAAIHSGKRILILEDIANFFPNTTEPMVRDIWKYQFHCSDEVVDILTKLTTYQGCLPQGWKTSGYLANLALGEVETKLVDKFVNRRLSYSRFVDDITVSSKRFLSNKEKSEIISEIYGMLSSGGYKAKRSKHEIATRTRKMNVTGITVNGKTPSLHGAEQHRIRAMVHKVEQSYAKNIPPVEYRKMWNSASGHINRITQFNPVKGTALRNRLNKIKPL